MENTQKQQIKVVTVKSTPASIQRASIIEKHLDALVDYERLPTNEAPYFKNSCINIFLNTDLVKKNKKDASGILEDMFETVETNPVILDLSLTDRVLTDLDIIAMGISHEYTTDTANTQKDIFTLTGKIAPLIVDSDTVFSNCKEPKPFREEPKIIWFGSKEDQFSVRKEVIKNKDLLDLVFDTPYNKKLFNIKMGRANIVYLPKTYTELQEFNRKQKAIKALKEGKFVIAPDCDEDTFFNGTLEEGISFYQNTNTEIEHYVVEMQEKLKQKYGSSSSETLKHLDNVCKEALLQNLEDLNLNEDFAEDIVDEDFEEDYDWDLEDYDNNDVDTTDR